MLWIRPAAGFLLSQNKNHESWSSSLESSSGIVIIIIRIVTKPPCEIPFSVPGLSKQSRNRGSLENVIFVLLTVLNTGRRPRCHNLLEEGRKWFQASPTCRLPACLVCVIHNVMVMMRSPCWQWWQWLVMRSYWKKIKTMLDNVKKTLPCGGWHVTVPHTVECYQGPPNNNLVSWGLLYIYNFHRKERWL